MASRTYGQYCGLARALELVGERWALLIVRDLVLGPKRFTDLRKGLPRIPTNILSARLKELEESGVVQRRVLPRPAASVVYELTPYGAELEEVVITLGRWGARSLGDPGPEDTLNDDSMALALRTSFQPEAARGMRASFEVRVGELVVHARVDNGSVQTGKGPLPEADLVLEAQASFKALLFAEIGPGEALENGKVRVEGDPELLRRFVEVFHLSHAPCASAEATG